MNHFSYFSEIEEAFVKRRGRHLLLSPLDWALMEAWREKGVPLRIVLRAISGVFDRIDANPGRASAVRSLSFCEDAVESEYRSWLESQTGGERSVSVGAVRTADVRAAEPDTREASFLGDGDEIEAHITAVAEKLATFSLTLDPGSSAVIEDVVSRLAEPARKEEFGSDLEGQLDQIDDLVDRALLEVSDSRLLADLRQEIGRELEKQRTLTDSVSYGRTVELMLRKRLRERAGLPRLGLYNL